MKHLSKHLFIGILLEVIVLLFSYIEANGNITHFFQAAARLSGRVSLLYFSMLLVYDTLYRAVENNSLQVKFILARNFAILHIIHWFLLATAVKLSGFALVPVRVVGGALAYLMIVLLPFIIKRKFSPALSLRLVFSVYIPYVWLIFFATYLTRVTGKAVNVTGAMPAYWLLTLITIILMAWRTGKLIKDGFSKKVA